MNSFQLFSFFHLNLAYSAIEEEQRLAVIQRCYWPLLNLAEKHNLPFSIELSAYTLEQIAAVDPAWIDKLKWLISHGRCELIGCGYAQVIGPLVPADMNAANLRIGMQVYESILGLRPTVALVNEQAYSAGMVELYLEAGYQAIIMEWNNPASGHPEWNAEWRYLPQKALGPRDEAIALIWNKSIAFQKFQRYVHGEIELEEYLSYIYSHASSSVRAFPIYGNDVEVFDYRPGRYMTEEPLHGEGEWSRIEKLYATLAADPRSKLIKTSEVLNLLGESQAGHSLRLESAAQPIPVKKQEKYNVLRWAVTGRDDVFINTRCRQIFEVLKDSSAATEEDWRELSYLYSSDFRTHITEKRWNVYLQRLQSMHEHWVNAVDFTELASTNAVHSKASSYTVEKKGHYWVINGANIEVSLNAHRGLALESLVDKKTNQPIFGTLHHGYFDDIQWGADFYSGHLVFQSPGRHKVTDLSSVEPTWEERDGTVIFSANIKTSMGLIEKQWQIDDAHQTLTLSYKLNWEEAVIGSLRLGHITLFPDRFKLEHLVFKTHNGGRHLESFDLGELNIDHGEAISFLISGKQALGMTQGYIELSDAQKTLAVQTNPSQIALVGLVTHQFVDGRQFNRIALSAMEIDDTSKLSAIKNKEIKIGFTLKNLAC
jgi:hypothetical protein